MKPATQRLGYRGYVTSRPFGGYNIPVPVQSLALRDYCRRNGMLYVLPTNENVFPHSYLVLEGLIGDLAAYEGIVMCSMHMLPSRAARRQAIYESIIGQGGTLHLVLEEQVVATPADIRRLEDTLMYYELAGSAGPAAALVNLDPPPSGE